MITAIPVFETHNFHFNNTKTFSHWKLVGEKQVLEKRMDCLSLKELDGHPPGLWVYDLVMSVSYATQIG